MKMVGDEHAVYTCKSYASLSPKVRKMRRLLEDDDVSLGAEFPIVDLGFQNRYHAEDTNETATPKGIHSTEFLVTRSPRLMGWFVAGVGLAATERVRIIPGRFAAALNGAGKSTYLATKEKDGE